MGGNAEGIHLTVCSLSRSMKRMAYRSCATAFILIGLIVLGLLWLIEPHLALLFAGLMAVLTVWTWLDNEASKLGKRQGNIRSKMDP